MSYPCHSFAVRTLLCDLGTSVVNHLSNLNSAQREAVKYDAGPLIVLAGPGTGKTRVIIARLVRLLEDGHAPDSLLALTFSVKAAEEMRFRLVEAVDERVAARVRMHTFHSFGKDIIDRFGDWTGLRRDMVLMDSAMSRRLLRRLIIERNLFTDRAAEGRDSVIARVRSFIGACRNAACTPQKVLAYAQQTQSDLKNPPSDLAADPDALAARRIEAGEFLQLAQLYEAYDKACRDDGLFTFDDLLTLPLAIFEQKHGAASILRDELRHVVVDEFQDVNAAQIEMLRHVVPPKLPSGKPPDLCVVGDDDQAIYGFRGADTHAFRRFADIWTTSKTVALTTNYRSGAPIIKAANAIITHAQSRFAPDKVIESDPAPLADDHSSVEGVITDDGAAGSVIAAMILDDRARNPSRNWSNYAVIARTNGYAEDIASELELAGVPIARRRRITPLDDLAVRDLLAWLRVLTHEDDTTNVHRLLTRPPCNLPPDVVKRWLVAYERAKWDGETMSFADWLATHHADDQTVARFVVLRRELLQATQGQPANLAIDHVAKRSGVTIHEHLEPSERAARIARIVKVLTFAQSCQPHLEQPGDLAAFLRHYDDLDDNEKQFDRAGDERISPQSAQNEIEVVDAVSIISAHSAKGLEYDTVFVVRVRPGFGFPYAERSDDADIALPTELTGAGESDHTDEERRLFYVACTRAERRLVLLANPKKKRGKATDYFIEITEDTQGLQVPITAGDDWLTKTNVVARDAMEAVAIDADGARRDAMLERERRRARQEAFAALHDAQRVGDEAGMQAIIERLSHAARSIAALEAMAQGSELPAFLVRVPEEQAQWQAIADRVRRASPEDQVPTLKPPLELSYTMVDQYLNCPRCFYMRYVLGYSEPETGAINIGIVVHGALQKFMLETMNAEADGQEPPGVDRLRAIGDGLFRMRTPRSQSYDRASHEKVQSQLELYFERLHDDAEVLQLERSTKFAYPHAGLTHHFTAKLDRVDRLPDGRIRIVDYKTGNATKKLLEPKSDDLQLCIYAMALPRLLDPSHPDPVLPAGVAEYWLLSTGERGTIDLAQLKLDKAREQIDKSIAGILAGSFEKGKSTRHLCEGFIDE